MANLSCAHFNILMYTIYVRFEYQSQTVVCADIKPLGTGWIWNASSWWMALSSVQPSHCAHGFSIWDKPIHVVIACCSTVYNHISMSICLRVSLDSRSHWKTWLMSQLTFVPPPFSSEKNVWLSVLLHGSASTWTPLCPSMYGHTWHLSIHTFTC